MKNEPPLDNRYHDQPDRHKYGAAFLEPETPSTWDVFSGAATASSGSSDAPARADHVHGHASVIAGGVPSTITPLVTQTASAGVSNNVARSDHVHGLTGIPPNPSYAYATITAVYTTDITGSGAYQASSTSGVVSLVNPDNYQRLAKLSTRHQTQILNSSGGALAGYIYSEYAFTTDGSSPSAYTAFGGASGSSAIAAGELLILNHVNEEFFYVPALATLKVNTRIQFYGTNANIAVSDYALVSTIVLFN